MFPFKKHAERHLSDLRPRVPRRVSRGYRSAKPDAIRDDDAQQWNLSEYLQLRRGRDGGEK